MRYGVVYTATLRRLHDAVARGTPVGVSGDPRQLYLIIFTLPPRWVAK